MNLARQIAIFSIQDNYIDKDYEQIAEEFGDIFKKYGLSAIIIGGNKLNRIAAISIRKKGNHVLGVMFENENILETYYYDFIITLKNDFQDNYLGVILASCGGVIVIGNPNLIGFKLPIDKNNNIVIIDKSSTNDYLYGSMTIPTFKSIEEGVIYIIQNNPYLTDANYFKEGIRIRYGCYPIGDKGEYLKSADLFLKAAFKGILEKDYLPWNVSTSSYYNSMGDHSYYHENDFFKAASFYSEALHYLKQLNIDQMDEYAKEMYHYLISIIVECVGFSIDRKIGDIDLAITIGERAIELYKKAKEFSNKYTEKCYNHTIVGLEGWIEYLYAKKYCKNKDYKNALESLKKSLEKYEKALYFLPQWKTSGFSDNISVSENEISELLVEIKLLKLSDKLDIFSLKDLVEKKLKGEKND